MDVEIFYPAHKNDYPAAKAICAQCPVKAECLDANIWEDHGIFGGTAPHERTHGLRRGRGLPEVTALCAECGHGFLRQNSQRIFCSSACRKRSSRRARREAA